FKVERQVRQVAQRDALHLLERRQLRLEGEGGLESGVGPLHVGIAVSRRVRSHTRSDPSSRPWGRPPSYGSELLKTSPCIRCPSAWPLARMSAGSRSQ